MPYRRQGKKVQIKKLGRWETLKRHESVQRAEEHLAALRINVEAKKHG